MINAKGKDILKQMDNLTKAQQILKILVSGYPIESDGYKIYMTEDFSLCIETDTLIRVSGYVFQNARR